MDNFPDTICSDLHELGVRKGMILLVHSSLKSLGTPGVTPEDVIQGLLQALGPNGTLLIPALSWELDPPYTFSLNESPCCIGAIPEYFRKRNDTVRSLHPTHSVCGVGPAVENLFAAHGLDTTPLGPNSPFRKLLKLDARILMLGCTLKPMTTMHTIEEMAESEYVLGDYADYTITDSTGKTYTKKYRMHGFKGYNQRYDRIELLDEPGLLNKGNVLKAESFLVDTQKLKKAALDKLDNEPLFFVDKINSS